MTFIASASRRVAARRTERNRAQVGDADRTIHKASRILAKALIMEGLEDMQSEAEEAYTIEDDDDYQLVAAWYVEAWLEDGDKSYLDGYQIVAASKDPYDLSDVLHSYTNRNHPPKLYYGAVEKWEFDMMQRHSS